MLRHISRVSTVLALVAALPAQAEILEFGPFDLGLCIDCDEIVIDPNQRNQNQSAVFERGDFNGIWGTGGAAILMLETFDGDRMHVNWNPAGGAVVQIWGTGGTAINPADPDFVGIWGTGGTAIAP